MKIPIDRFRLRFRRPPPEPAHAEDWQACRYDFHCSKCAGARCRNNNYHDRLEDLIYPPPEEQLRHARGPRRGAAHAARNRCAG